MHTLIVTAHPDAGSYTKAVAEAFIAGLAELPGHSWEVADLFAEGFDPRFNAQDNAVFNGRSEPAADTQAEQQRIDRADRLVLVFPVYWWSMPALMKGWIDRVFTQGWAFDYDAESGVQKRLTHLKAQIIGIAGAPQETYLRRGYLDALRKQLAEGIFDYCGVEVTALTLLHPLDSAAQQAGLAQARALGQQSSEAVHQASAC